MLGDHDRRDTNRDQRALLPAVAVFAMTVEEFTDTPPVDAPSRAALLRAVGKLCVFWFGYNLMFVSVLVGVGDVDPPLPWMSSAAAVGCVAFGWVARGWVRDWVIAYRESRRSKATHGEDRQPFDAAMFLAVSRLWVRSFIFYLMCIFALSSWAFDHAWDWVSVVGWVVWVAWGWGLAYRQYRRSEATHGEGS